MKAREIHIAAAVLLAMATFTTGCSIKKMAVNALSNALSESEKTYLSDDDPELVVYSIRSKTDVHYILILPTDQFFLHTDDSVHFLFLKK